MDASDTAAMLCEDGSNSCGSTQVSEDNLAERTAKIAACENPQDAIALFDEAAWEAILESHDENMRSGGLDRIYPTASSKQYTRFMGSDESYLNVVLRRWHEAGGEKLFETLASSPESDTVKNLP